MRSVFSSLVLLRSVVAVASLLRGQFAWRPVYGGQLSVFEIDGVLSGVYFGPLSLIVSFNKQIKKLMRPSD